MKQNKVLSTNTSSDLLTNKEDSYKKEIFALKTTLEDKEHEVRELNKKVERLQKVEAELQELNMKYYNEAKNSRREIVSLKQDLEVAKDNELKAEVIFNAKQQAVKAFVERFIKEELTNYSKIYNEYEIKRKIDDLLKELQYKE